MFFTWALFSQHRLFDEAISSVVKGELYRSILITSHRYPTSNTFFRTRKSSGNVLPSPSPRHLRHVFYAVRSGSQCPGDDTSLVRDGSPEQYDIAHQQHY
ncbi:hypothetical protein JTE90_009785 [Oedothorax gibbosus]|uniref:Uncharacterized protein n=1 Tax=Oedothorax gibbosus TaxID=931172 RepID=A0AAV6VAS0_9ARAC|nr:hypothetical protein JTE90_009785 [Oedothorax gibbosus]